MDANEEKLQLMMKEDKDGEVARQMRLETSEQSKQVDALSMKAKPAQYDTVYSAGKVHNLRESRQKLGIKLLLFSIFLHFTNFLINIWMAWNKSAGSKSAASLPLVDQAWDILQSHTSLLDVPAIGI